MHRALVLIFCIIAIYSSIPVYSSPNQGALTPVVLWHGMGDTCCYSFSMGRLKDLIEKTLPGIYVHSLMIGADETDDEWNGFFMNVNDQITNAYQQLQNDSKLQNGFNAIGFSQGSQFLRGYVQRYNDPPIKNLISIGGQHQGVFGFPRCPGDNYTLCNWVRELLDIGAYVSYIQEYVVQAEYWQDPYNEDEYLKYSVFLPDINNEGAKKNDTYKKNLMSLQNFVMVKFLQDGMVQPIESEWFGFYKPGGIDTIIDLRDSQLYIEDWLGLQVMDKAGKLHFLSVYADHLKFTDDWFVENIVPYLK